MKAKDLIKILEQNPEKEVELIIYSAVLIVGIVASMALSTSVSEGWSLPMIITLAFTVIMNIAMHIRR